MEPVLTHEEQLLQVLVDRARVELRDLPPAAVMVELLFRISQQLPVGYVPDPGYVRLVVEVTSRHAEARTR